MFDFLHQVKKQLYGCSCWGIIIIIIIITQNLFKRTYRINGFKIIPRANNRQRKRKMGKQSGILGVAASKYICEFKI